MIERVWSIIFKEFIQIRRDRLTLAIALAMPLMQLILFGYAINTTVDHIATVVLDQARDAQSWISRSFFNTSYFDLVGQAGPPGRSTRRSMHTAGWDRAAPGFSRLLAPGGATAQLVTMDPVEHGPDGAPGGGRWARALEWLSMCDRWSSTTRVCRASTS